METVTATLEWHYYCPKCERACLTRFSGSDESWRTTCSDCGTKYEVRPTPRALDDDERCDCGEPFPKNGYCRFCGAHARHRQERKTLLVVSIGSLVYLVATAPEGYEDERGFHRVEK